MPNSVKSGGTPTEQDRLSCGSTQCDHLMFREIAPKLHDSLNAGAFIAPSMLRVELPMNGSRWFVPCPGTHRASRPLPNAESISDQIEWVDHGWKLYFLYPTFVQ